jgi:hypothetical protein
VKISPDWPNDADGDVFRKLARRGFDFSRSYAVDYNVDFERWPPHPDAVVILRRMYGDVALLSQTKTLAVMRSFK